MEAVQFDSSTGCLSISGEMTIYQAVLLKNAIVTVTGGAPVFQLDLSRITELDTAGLQLLFCLHAANPGMQINGENSDSLQSVSALLGLSWTARMPSGVRA